MPSPLWSLSPLAFPGSPLTEKPFTRSSAGRRDRDSLSSFLLLLPRELAADTPWEMDPQNEHIVGSRTLTRPATDPPAPGYSGSVSGRSSLQGGCRRNRNKVREKNARGKNGDEAWAGSRGSPRDRGLCGCFRLWDQLPMTDMVPAGDMVCMAPCNHPGSEVSPAAVGSTQPPRDQLSTDSERVPSWEPGEPLPWSKTKPEQPAQAPRISSQVLDVKSVPQNPR